MTENSCACMSEWLALSFRSVLLLHVDGNVNLYVNVIQQTGYHHQSYFLTHRIQQNYANLAPMQPESHERPSFQTHIYYENNSELYISYMLHYYNYREWMMLGKGIRGWMPSDSSRLSMRVNTRKAITESDCSLSKVRLHLMSEHYQVCSIHPQYIHPHTHPPTHLISCNCFVFGGLQPTLLLHISLNWMQVRDASLPQWNCDVAAWFWGNAFEGIYYYYF